MTIDDTVSPPDMLVRLDDCIQGQRRLVYDFAKFFVGRLGNEPVNITRYILDYDAAVNSLQAGKPIGQEVLPPDLSGKNEIFYYFLRTAFPLLTRALTPQKFADQACAFYSQAGDQASE